MELFDRQLPARQRRLRPDAVWASGPIFPRRPIVQQELLAMLAAAVVVVLGPDVLATIARTSEVWIQIVLGLCRNCLPLLRILGE